MAGKRAALLAGLTAALLAAMPARAQDGGFDMEALKRQLDRAWDDVMRDFGPTIDDLGAALDTLKQVDSLEHYEAPEMLPNGDIIMRRKPGAPPLGAEPEAAPDKPTPRLPGGQTAPDPGIRT